MRKTINGFTMIEILIVIAVIGILSTIGTISFSKIQTSSRDTQRLSKVTVIAEALEKYYDQNGEYPSCDAMMQDSSTVKSNTLKGIDPEILATPNSAAGTNSITSCSTDPASDVFAYIINGSQWTLKYLEESTGVVKGITSRRGFYDIASPSAPVVAVALNGSNVLATVSPVTCAAGYTVEYGINSRINSEAWAGFTSWSAAMSATQAAADGVKYSYQAQARCSNGSIFSSSAVGMENSYTDPITAPVAPSVTASTSSNTTTYSWNATACPSGSTARYQYRYTTDYGYDSGWVAHASNSVAFTTATESYTYTVQVQAQCYNANTTSGWSGIGSASYYRPRAVIVSAGSCAISTNGQAYCWGLNTYGQLGNNSTVSSKIPVAVYTGGALSGKTIKSISTGELSSCAIASDDKAYCWGFNNSGQLGNNSLTNSSVPVAVNTSGALSGKTMKSISTGSYGTCAIASDDKAYCWGWNNVGQLGNNSLIDSSVPVAVYTGGALSGKTMKSISSSLYANCAIASDDKAYCWGSASSGGLGNNSFTNSPVPVAVYTSGALSGKTIKSIAGSDEDTHTCVIASDNQAYCWGYNYYGQLGNNSTAQSSVPVAVYNSGILSGKSILSIAAGNHHSCAVASDNKAYCWGYNISGQLGNNSTTNSLVPVAIYAAF